VSDKVDLIMLIGGVEVEEQAAIQWERSMWLIKGGDKRGSGDHVR
jgi:hypothetical protein